MMTIRERRGASVEGDPPLWKVEGGSGWKGETLYHHFFIIIMTLMTIKTLMIIMIMTTMMIKMTMMTKMTKMTMMTID